MAGIRAVEDQILPSGRGEFYVVFIDGQTKIRGLACRRHDTPEFIKQAQEGMLTILARARSVDELQWQRQESRRIYDDCLARLESGKVDPRLLIIEQVLSREIEDYTVETRASLAARELIADGVNVRPGEKIDYVITDSKAKKKTERVSTTNRNVAINYDRQEYVNRLTIAAREIGVVYDDDSPEDLDESSPPLLQLMNPKPERIANGEENGDELCFDADRT